jgi:hypothetical protein
MLTRRELFAASGAVALSPVLPVAAVPVGSPFMFIGDSIVRYCGADAGGYRKAFADFAANHPMAAPSTGGWGSWPMDSDARHPTPEQFDQVGRFFTHPITAR